MSSSNEAPTFCSLDEILNCDIEQYFPMVLFVIGKHLTLIHAFQRGQIRCLPVAKCMDESEEDQ